MSWRNSNTSADPKRDCIPWNVGIRGSFFFTDPTTICVTDVYLVTAGLNLPPDYHLAGRQFLSDKLPEQWTGKHCQSLNLRYLSTSPQITFCMNIKERVSILLLAQTPCSSETIASVNVDILCTHKLTIILLQAEYLTLRVTYRTLIWVRETWYLSLLNRA